MTTSIIQENTSTRAWSDRDPNTGRMRGGVGSPRLNACGIRSDIGSDPSRKAHRLGGPSCAPAKSPRETAVWIRPAEGSTHGTVKWLTCEAWITLRGIQVSQLVGLETI
jgi:hypothetical protein